MLIRGGLWFGIAVAIFTSVSSDVVAKESLHSFRNELNQICWDARCSSREKDVEIESEDKIYCWILKEKYRNSRTKVIGKAIADCVTEKNEFEGKSATDIITFDFDEKAPSNKYINPASYKPEHWNAVILYNYVHEMINNSKIDPDQINNEEYLKWKSDVRVVLTSKLQHIRAHYANYFNDNSKVYYPLERAVKDIQKYVNALNLGELLHEFSVSKREYNNAKGTSLENIVPTAEISSGNKKPTLKMAPFFRCDSYKQDGTYKKMIYKPIFTCYNDSLYISSFDVIVDCYKEKNENGEFNSSLIPITWKTYEEFKKHCEWLKERLGTLVEIPDEKLFNILNK